MKRCQSPSFGDDQRPQLDAMRADCGNLDYPNQMSDTKKFVHLLGQLFNPDVEPGMTARARSAVRRRGQLSNLRRGLRRRHRRRDRERHAPSRAHRRRLLTANHRIGVTWARRHLRANFEPCQPRAMSLSHGHGGRLWKSTRSAGPSGVSARSLPTIAGSNVCIHVQAVEDVRHAYRGIPHAEEPNDLMSESQPCAPVGKAFQP